MAKIFVANWKQSGTRKDAFAWIETFDHERSVFSEEKEIIVCPPLKALDLVAEAIEDKKLPIKVGVQSLDSKVFEGEKNTGAVSPALLSDSAAFAIIGHSETRKNQNLTDSDVAEKIKLAKVHNLTPIVCVSEIAQAEALKNLLGDFTDIIAYEPLFAIGTGTPDTPESANAVATKIKALFPKASVLYGGSVDGANVQSFLLHESISGVLVGNRSLGGPFFLEIVKNAK